MHYKISSLCNGNVTLAVISFASICDTNVWRTSENSKGPRRSLCCTPDSEWISPRGCHNMDGTHNTTIPMAIGTFITENLSGESVKGIPHVHLENNKVLIHPVILSTSQTMDNLFKTCLAGHTHLQGLQYACSFCLYYCTQALSCQPT